MHKFNVTLVASLVAVAAVLGAVAVTRTTHLGTAAQQANDAAFVARTRQLTAFAARLRQELKARPPALPPVPKPPPVTATPAATPAATSQAPRIVYHRPPPIVHVIHHHGDDGSGESDGGGGGDD